MTIFCFDHQPTLTLAIAVQSCKSLLFISVSVNNFRKALYSVEVFKAKI
jgi:hypothetical protein